jgi:hypothetical protein
MHNADFSAWKRHHDRDVHKNTSWNWGISGWKSSIFEVEDGESAPCWIGHGLLLYFVIAISGWSWVYRAFLASKVTKRKEHIRKFAGWVGQTWT